MYLSPNPPDENRQCYECDHYHYDSFHDESWCDELIDYKWRPSIIDPGGTCEYWKAWKVKEQEIDYDI
jgi:hypothetical protein